LFQIIDYHDVIICTLLLQKYKYCFTESADANITRHKTVTSAQQ